MKDRNIYIGGAIIIAVIIGFWAWSREKTPEIPVETGQTTVFKNASGELLSVIFDNTNKTASIDGLLLTQVESASGARYRNAEEGLELWNKGIEATLSRGETVLFRGQTTQESPVGDVWLYVFAGPTWIWHETQMNNGAIIYPKKPGAHTLTFDSAKGAVRGTTDCNGFGGEYTSGAVGVLSFGPFVSTEMFCGGSQEAEFMKMISDSGRYIFSESGDLVLLLKNDSGAVVFKRQ